MENYLHKVGIGFLLYGSSSCADISQASLPNIPSGLQEYSLNIEITENCDGSVTFVHDDCETCIPDRPLFPQDDFLRVEEWWSNVRWDQVNKKKYRKFEDE